MRKKSPLSERVRKDKAILFATTNTGFEKYALFVGFYDAKGQFAAVGERSTMRDLRPSARADRE